MARKVTSGVGSIVLFTLVSAGPAFGQVFRAVHGVDSAGYQKWSDRVTKDGYRPVYVNGPGGVEAFDAAMRRFMSDRSIPAGTLAVSRDGKLLLSRGYGFADRGKTRAVRADDPFRLASVVKPITAAAVRKLVAGGKLRMDTKV